MNYKYVLSNKLNITTLSTLNSFCSKLSLIGFTRKPSPGWRLVCTRVIGKFSWDQRKEGTRTGQREKLSCDAVSMKASAHPVEGSEMGSLFHGCCELG